MERDGRESGETGGRDEERQEGERERQEGEMKREWRERHKQMITQRKKE